MNMNKIFKTEGFSLLEMAIVLLIVSLLMGGLLMSVSTTQEMNYRTDAEMKLEEMLESLYGFAQANGRLPCPATATTNGAEDPPGGGACTQQHGFIPSATLGLAGPINTDSLLMDDWLSAYRYSVSSANGNAFTTVNGMRTTGIAALTPDLRICDAAACGTVVANTLPVVIMSLGADWDEFTAADVDETENSGEATINGYRLPNDNNFVVSTYIEDVFDDLLTWMSPNILYTRMISAGQLP
ncbi:MAG: prepilin-type N-terminal cleavage/methylation domain-containing protein [Pseudomonadales bacterium]|nr:prepilin-type N-terminal cleavage/methylation domain-containing protein [Pseudomonadales bacterium]